MTERKPAKGKGRGGAARGYTWPPFEPGNKAAVRHGAQSPALVEPRARELAPAILEANPHLDAVRDGAGVYRYCVLLARCERVYAWLAEQDDEVFADSESGEPHGVYGKLGEWERAADRAEERLAIAPLTRARLGLDELRAAALSDEEIAERRAARRRLDARWDAIDAGAQEGGDDE